MLNMPILRRNIIVATVLLLFVSGCSFGPGMMQSSRAAYNMAVQKSANEELLINIVRLRYREPIQFLQISNITAQYSYSQNLNLSGTIPGNGKNIMNAAGAFGYSERPTISFKILEGKEFVNQFLEETSLTTILHLIRSGWNIERVCRIMVDSVGDMQNFPMQPSYYKFVELVKLWDELQGRGDLSFSLEPGKTHVVADAIPESRMNLTDILSAAQAGFAVKSNPNRSYSVTKNGAPSLMMQLRFSNEAEANKADALLGVHPKHIAGSDGGVVEYIHFIDPLEDDGTLIDASNGAAIIKLKLRSYSNQLSAIGRGIEIPEKDKAIIRTFTNAQGETVDIRTAFSDLLDIRSSTYEPDNALVAIPFRGVWFYIDQDDRQSVSTLALLNLLYSLQADKGAAGPVLTIPVGG